MNNSITLNDFNTQVIVTMIDTKTDKIEVRTIAGNNVMYFENNKWIVFEKEDQEKALLTWIKVRANKQHETKLQLISWAIVHIGDDDKTTVIK